MDEIKFFVTISVPSDERVWSDENFSNTEQTITVAVSALAELFGGTVSDLEIK